MFFFDCLLDSLKDGALAIPILFLSYLFMEWLEGSEKLNETVLSRSSLKTGPIIGGLVGVVPQCGIAGAAATLFSTGAISVGTMLAVFFSTSDEMLPVMLSHIHESGFALNIAAIVLGKAAAGIVLGYAADLIFRLLPFSEKSIHGFCENEHCSCDDEEGSIWASALKHTVKIAILIIAVNLALNLILGWFGSDSLKSTLLSRPVIGEVLLALFGLIPNCSISVAITEAYLNGIISLGGLFSGLLANSGIGLVVLFRTNRVLKENLIIVSILFILSALTGVIISVV